MFCFVLFCFALFELAKKRGPRILRSYLFFSSFCPLGHNWPSSTIYFVTSPELKLMRPVGYPRRTMLDPCSLSDATQKLYHTPQAEIPLTGYEPLFS